jgi:hypothetical protein
MSLHPFKLTTAIPPLTPQHSVTLWVLAAPPKFCPICICLVLCQNDDFVHLTWYTLGAAIYSQFRDSFCRQSLFRIQIFRYCPGQKLKIMAVRVCYHSNTSRKMTCTVLGLVHWQDVDTYYVTSWMESQGPGSCK